ncbi:type I restriction-modification system, specificity subunit S [Geofilum rubicundum JCM 15548]|uniref:Type I restriction-modification system, specificity subunit S n=1 Tax=Geofilum rubicundum JCM 15548 TaxID=1236989 RepID=A0A0E9M024_9BACT|nr:type I restriction-modification system, specificity subunit S [Geofilum rubicundum JCM 15548]
MEWLGEIPEHWECTKMKHLFQDVSIKKKANAELLSVTQDQGVVPRTWVENRMVMPSGALESFKYINKGDFAISLRSFEGGLEYCHHDGIISPAYTVLKAKRNFESQFYKYLFKSFSFISELQTSVVGIRQGKNISFEELSYSYLPIPPLPEQTAIAAFLDCKTALIDQAVGIKQKQIELLKERRKILIHKAVTRGLNPNVKMKDSGVEWIGEIPEHWELLFMNYAINAIADVDHYMPPTIENGVPYVMTGDLKEFASDIDFDGCKKVSRRDYYNLSKKIKSSIGDVILARYATIGTASYVNIDLNFIVSYSCVTIKPNPSKLLGLYLFYYFKSDAFVTDIKNQVNTNTQGNVGIGNLKKVKLVIPPINEQYEIVKHIETSTTKIATTISLKEQEIEKLKEYKATLINSAVTGKIKVC